MNFFDENARIFFEKTSIGNIYVGFSEIFEFFFEKKYTKKERFAESALC